MDVEVDLMFEAGVLGHSRSPWNAQPVVVPKPDGTPRFCLNHRPVNCATKVDRYPMPLVDDMLDRLGTARMFSSLDFKCGYWQIPMDPADVEKTAFSTRKGHFEFLRMPFGLVNAPATFQQTMDLLFAGDQYVLVYMDHLIIFSHSFEEHLMHLERVFQKLADAGLQIAPKKCCLGADSLKYLGHLVTVDGVSPDPAKVAAIKDCPLPEHVSEVRGFLGCAGYYRRFIPNFATVAGPLTDLTAQSEPFVWTPARDAAFSELKHLLTSAPVLRRPDYDLPFLVQTDWQPFAVSVVCHRILRALSTPLPLRAGG